MNFMLYQTNEIVEIQEFLIVLSTSIKSRIFALRYTWSCDIGETAIVYVTEMPTELNFFRN